MNPFDHTPPEVRAAERWLRSIDPPAMPDGLSARIQSAVRAELARQAASGRPMAWQRWHGAAAAVAMLVLSAGLVHLGAARQRAALERLRPVEQFATALERVEFEDAALAMLAEEIDSLRFGSSMDEPAEIDALWDEIDEKLHDWTNTTDGKGRPGNG